LESGATLALSGDLTVGVSGELSLLGSDATASELSVAGDLTNSGQIATGHNLFLPFPGDNSLGGGQIVTVKGTLTNSGEFDIYDYSNSDTVVTVGGLASTGTINLGSSFFPFESSGTSKLDVLGPATHSAGAINIYSGGLLSVGNGNAFVQTGGTTYVAGGLAASNIDVEGGVVEFASALTDGDGTGEITIGGTGVVQFGGAVDSSHVIDFADSTGKLVVNDASDFHGVIKDFGIGDIIDLPDVSSVPLAGIVDSYSGGVLTIEAIGSTVTSFDIVVAPADSNDVIATIADDHNGTEIVVRPSSPSPPPSPLPSSPPGSPPPSPPPPIITYSDITAPGETVPHGSPVAIGIAPPALADDNLNLTRLSGPAGALTFSGGIVSFVTPASGNVAFSYEISDQAGDVSAVISDTLAVDPGPGVADTTTAGEKVAHGTVLAVGTATSGLSGDILTLTQLSGPAGALTLSDGVVNFAAPTNASGNVAFSYEISDQLGDVSVVVSDTLAVDPGPTAGNAHLYLSPGQSVDLTHVLLALDTPGLFGDTLALTAVDTTETQGTVSLSNGYLSYTAPASGGSDAFGYTVSDQLLETATGNVSVSLLAKSTSFTLTGSGNVVAAGGGNYSITGGTGGNSITLGSGNDSVLLSGDNNTVVVGRGNDTISLSGENNAVTLGDGNDSVSSGADSTIKLGNGNDTVYAKANSKIVLGSGNDIVYAGANDAITLGTGHDTVAFGVSPDPMTIGNETVTNFAKGDTLEFNHLLLSAAAAMSNSKQVGQDTIIAVDPHDTVTLQGVAVSSLTASLFKFV
jgi:Ca2+-binding RTX toxin-like protein